MDHEDIQIKEGRRCKCKTYARDEKCIYNVVHKGTLWRLRCRWDCNEKLYLTSIRQKCVDWKHRMGLETTGWLWTQ